MDRSPYHLANVVLNREWREGSAGKVGSRGLVARANWAIRVLSDLGAPPHPSSRLPNARNLLLGLNNEELILSPTDSALLERVTDANKTIWELFVIANAALRRHRVGKPFPLHLLQLALTGADLTSDDKNNKARNTQFELYVASLLTLGAAEVQIAEPDLRFLYWGEFLGLAAKRMTSTKATTLENRLVEAVGQIAAHTGRGFVAVNVDAFYVGATRAEGLEERARQFNERVAIVSDVVRRRFGPLKAARGVLIFGHLTSWSFEGEAPSFDTSYPTTFLLIEDEVEPGSRARGEEFFEGLMPRIDRELTRLRSNQVDFDLDTV